MKPIKALKMRNADPGKYYWRIRCTARGGGSVYVIGEIEWIATAGGSDITPVLSGTDARVIASSYYTTINYFPWKAYDSAGGSWANDPSDPTNPWIGWNFGSPQPIYSVKLTGTNGFQNPSGFDVQYSADGSTWTTAKSFTYTWSGSETVEFVL